MSVVVISPREGDCRTHLRCPCGPSFGVDGYQIEREKATEERDIDRGVALDLARESGSRQ
jgi:hypothetical protein